MGLLVGESGDAFFAGRQWLDRGMRYPDLEGGATAGGDELDAVEVERQAITAALENELEELEAVFDEDRLASIVWGSKAGARPPSPPPPKDGMLNLADVDRLCAEDAALEVKGAAGSGAALSVLAAFVVTGGGVAGARRSAIAYLGGTAGRGGDVVFDAVVAAFLGAKAAGLRRTAGDALSDLGDPRAVPLAASSLLDASPLVRWRAARILGELGEGSTVVAALKQASFDESAFDVAFEMKDAARKVAARAEGGDQQGGQGGSGFGPVWKQIRDAAGTGEGA